MRRTNRPFRKIEHGVLVDEEVLLHLLAHSLRVIFDRKKSPYPIIIDAEGRLRDLLHRYTFGFVYGFDLLQDDTYVIHHKRPNKKNCRVENLVRVLRADHARLHRQLDKKKGEKHDVVGLWRPHERGTLFALDPDAPLEEDEAGRSARELYVPPTEWGEVKTLSLAAQEREAETLLDLFYEVIDHAAGRLDSGPTIPKTKTPGSSRDAASRAVGIMPIRLGCLRSEAALVRLLALNERPDGSFDIDAAARCVGFEPALVARFLRRPAVAVAIERWRRYRRLPKPCPEGWTRERSRRAG